MKLLLAFLILTALCFGSIPVARAESGHVQSFDNVARDSTTALDIDPELSFDLNVGNAELLITIFAQCGAGGLALKADPGGTTFTGAIAGVVTIARSGAPEVVNLTALDDVIVVNGAGPVTVTYHVIFKTDDLGTLKIKWAQAVSDPDPTIRRRGSLISVRDLDT